MDPTNNPDVQSSLEMAGSMLPAGTFDILNHPFELFVALVLTVVSTVWSIQGLRRKDIPRFLMGLAAGIPTIAIESFNAWALAAVVMALALWLKRKLENI